MPGRSPCTPSPCRSYAPGHHLHAIHAKHVARTPWQWRDGVVSGVDGDTFTVAYVDTAHELSVWHHRPLADVVSVGSPVRVHERYYVLGGPFGWVNVVISNGLGRLPEPEHPELHAADVVVPVVDLSTGRAADGPREMSRRRPLPQARNCRTPRPDSLQGRGKRVVACPTRTWRGRT